MGDLPPLLPHERESQSAPLSPDEVYWFVRF